MQSTITWLHISDLHLRASQSYNSNIVLRALLRDVSERIRNDGLPPDFIVVTGDIAFAGRPDEYVIAGRFFDDLLETTGLQKDRLFVVPGNHDVDRRAISVLAAEATAALTDRDAVNYFLSSYSDLHLILERFGNYCDFADRYFSSHLACEVGQSFFVREITAGRRRVAILGLNSALLACSDDDRNRLILGECQVRNALSAAREAAVRLAVMHHPFEWLQDCDRGDVEPLLCRDCDFVLHGHMHQVGLLQAHTPDTDAMIIAAGACYETRAYPNSYSFVQIDPDSRSGTAYLRMYSDRQGGFWTKDVTSYRNVPDGIYHFDMHRDMLHGLTVEPDMHKAPLKAPLASQTREADQTVDRVPGHEKRCSDLAESIQETIDLIGQYEYLYRLTDDPKTRQRARREIADLREQLAGHESEYRLLGCREE